MTGIKHDAGKLRWDLLPKDVEIEIHWLQKYRWHEIEELEALIDLEKWAEVACCLLQNELCTWEQIVEVFTKGAEKYGDNNWQQLKNPKARCYSALRRHNRAGINEKDFNIAHYAHMAVNAIFLRWFEKYK